MKRHSSCQPQLENICMGKLWKSSVEVPFHGTLSLQTFFTTDEYKLRYCSQLSTEKYSDSRVQTLRTLVYWTGICQRFPTEVNFQRGNPRLSLLMQHESLARMLWSSGYSILFQTVPENPKWRPTSGCLGPCSVKPVPMVDQSRTCWITGQRETICPTGSVVGEHARSLTLTGAL